MMSPLGVARAFSEGDAAVTLPAMTLLGQLLRGTLVGVGLVLQALVGLYVSGVKLGPLDLNDQQLALFPWIGLGFQLSAVALAVGAVARAQATADDEEDDEIADEGSSGTGRDLAGGVRDGYYATGRQERPSRRVGDESSERGTSRSMENPYRGMESPQGAQQGRPGHPGIASMGMDPAQGPYRASDADPWSGAHRFPGPDHASSGERTSPSHYTQNYDYPSPADRLSESDHLLSTPDHFSTPEISTPEHLSGDPTSQDLSTPDHLSRPDHLSTPEQWPRSPRGRRALPPQSGLPPRENEPRWPGDQPFQ